MAINLGIVFRKLITLYAVLSVTFVEATPWKGVVNLDLPALKKQAESGDAQVMSDYAFRSLYCLGGGTF